MIHNDADLDEMGVQPQPFREVAAAGGGMEYRPAMDPIHGDNLGGGGGGGGAGGGALDFDADRSPIDHVPLLLDDETDKMLVNDDGENSDSEAEEDCDLCMHGGGEDLGDKLKPKLDVVLSLERLNYTYMRSREMFTMVLRERRKIEDFLALQKKPFKRWNTDMVRRHYRHHGYNSRRMIGEDLQTCRILKRKLRRRMIQRNRDTGEEEPDGRAVDRFMRLCKTQSDLQVRFDDACAKENAAIAINNGAAPETRVSGSGWARKNPLGVNKMASVSTISIYEFSSGNKI